uniref:Putative transposase n=1 Tax=Candidatus Kentrum sp. LPFa TaxID=2126335 RepID=A0A450X4N6_9GAMM|nr:MAG: putative transposase [Candidatus Kentron sp. LPFa]VFK35810.1 MAG: putative transposase [Candidatus Kentron sp. LPFa]
MLSFVLFIPCDLREAMSNYRRADVPEAIYFFTVVTYHRRPWFDREERIEILREALRRTMTHRSFRIDAMVVLPDHIHCLWQLPEGDNDFSGRWREIKKSASRHLDIRVNPRNERSVWQRRFPPFRVRAMPSVQGRTRTGTLWFLSEPHGFRLSAESPRLTLLLDQWPITVGSFD